MLICGNVKAQSTSTFPLRERLQIRYPVWHLSCMSPLHLWWMNQRQYRVRWNRDQWTCWNRCRRRICDSIWEGIYSKLTMMIKQNTYVKRIRDHCYGYSKMIQGTNHRKKRSYSPYVVRIYCWSCSLRQTQNINKIQKISVDRTSTSRME